MSEAITGGCQCGAVRYRIEGALEKPTICHCRMCQKAFGSFFAPLVRARKSDFAVTRGTIAIFRSSDVVERGFCSACGTPLTFEELGRDAIDVSIGSLDDPTPVKPLLQYGIEGRMPWFAELAALPSVTTGEGEGPERVAAIAASNHQHPDHDTATWPLQGEGR
ncbi:GFA family protein [Faunimonas sp. B44]|uniref:GFA family protein n=1 Tax=Faunimonas sp. B44 TaxID=3461493 RepID=UPI004043A852